VRRICTDACICCLHLLPASAACISCCICCLHTLPASVLEASVHAGWRACRAPWQTCMRACRLARVQGTLADMHAAGMQPGLREHTALLDACKRAAQPALAARVMYHTLPELGIEPDAQAWNALLGAFGRNGDMDSAYATWQVCARLHLLDVADWLHPTA
jgi:Pentatricopeptide repeat domain